MYFKQNVFICVYKEKYILITSVTFNKKKYDYKLSIVLYKLCFFISYYNLFLEIV